MKEESPLGLRPRFIMLEHRLQEIDEAIMRYAEGGHDIPSEWITEIYKIEQELREIKKGNL